MKDATPHILCVIYGTELYGSERGTLQALTALRDAGAKVTVVGSGRKPEGGQTGKVIAELGFPLFLIPFGSHLKRSWMVYNREYRHMIFGRIRRCSIQFRQIRKETKPTHIMLCGTSPLPFILPALLFNRTKIIYRMGDAPVLSSKIHNPSWKWLIRRAETIVAISDFMRTHILSHAPASFDPSKVCVIRNIAPDRNTPLNPTTISQLQKNKRPLQLVYVGQLTENKGVGELIDALILLDDPNVGCWMVGDWLNNPSFNNPLQEKLRTSESATQIQFMGYCNDPRPYFNAADWHIAPSVYEEPLGNVVQEAQREGTPSIISNRGGLPELVQHEVSGLILNDTQSETIAGTIRRILTSPQLQAQLGEQAKQQFIQNGKPQFQSQWINAITSNG